MDSVFWGAGRSLLEGWFFHYLKMKWFKMKHIEMKDAARRAFGGAISDACDFSRGLARPG